MLGGGGRWVDGHAPPKPENLVRGGGGRVGETQTHHPHEETYIKAAAAPPIGGKSLIC